ncbi:hypothetical protein [Nitrosomonas sp.]|uniref:hypothetical protein n=1 Tax=Nitrosomonas sp. TaxID=42353 RepID=UPI001D354F5F|nr:hypothetical protein [Nitrosomonas sp.]MBX3616188.1 hypothetical protein [Nitrosomonas sp.]
MIDKNNTITSNNEKPAVSIGFNMIIIIATLIFPVIGIAMGFTYYRKNHPDEKRAGKRWLILGIIMLLLNILFINLVAPQKNI